MMVMWGLLSLSLFLLPLLSLYLHLLWLPLCLPSFLRLPLSVCPPLSCLLLLGGPLPSCMMIGVGSGVSASVGWFHCPPCTSRLLSRPFIFLPLDGDHLSPVTSPPCWQWNPPWTPLYLQWTRFWILVCWGSVLFWVPPLSVLPPLLLVLRLLCLALLLFLPFPHVPRLFRGAFAFWFPQFAGLGGDAM